MSSQFRRLLCCGAAAVALWAADPTFIGKWKMNIAKSDFGDTSITFAQAPSGGMQMTVDGQTYNFKTDGKDYDGMFGSRMSWKTINASTWEVTNKMGDKVSSVDTYTVAADGKSMTEASKGTSPAGAPFQNVVTFQRVTGTTGIVGKWKTKAVKMSAPGMIEVVSTGGDGISFRVPDQKVVCDGHLDGKFYPCKGEVLPPNTGLTFKKTGPNSMTTDVTIGGKIMYQTTYTGSADGKTLTETGNAAGTDEKYKAVYDRQ
jgi:hypothetical protein